jgi:hypothetical protein
MTLKMFPSQEILATAISYSWDRLHGWARVGLRME